MEGPAPVRLAWGAVALLVLVVVMARTWNGIWPQDGLVFWAGGAMTVAGDPHVYGDFSGNVQRVSEAFAETYCTDSFDPDGCMTRVLPFPSPPLLWPLLWPMGLLRPLWAVAAMRFVMWALLTGSTAVQLERWMADRPQDAPYAVASALFIFPAMFLHIETGQNVCLLVAAAVLLDQARRHWSVEVLAGTFLGMGTMFKVSPGVVVGAWMVERRAVAVLAFGATLLVALGLQVGAFGLAPWGEWQRNIADIDDALFKFPNGAIDTLAPQLGGFAGLRRQQVRWVASAIKLAWLAAAMATAWRAHRTGRPLMWVGWVTWLMWVPLVWTFYLWVGLAFALGPIARLGHPRWVVVGAAAHLAAMGLILGHHPASPLGVTAFILAFAAVVLWWTWQEGHGFSQAR